MHKNYLTKSGAFSVMMLVLISDSIIYGFADGIITERWLVLLVTLVASVPLMLLYARLVHLMPAADLFEMATTSVGRVFTVIMCLFYIFYFLNITAAIRAYYGEFIHLTSLKETSFNAILLAFFVICASIAKSGVNIMGRWCKYVLALTLTVVAAIFILSLQSMDFENLKPFVGWDMKGAAITGLKNVALPMGETVMLLTFIGGLDRKASPYKLFLYGIAFATVFFFVIYIHNLAMLGEGVVRAIFYPLYTATSVINISSGLRIEGIVTIAFLFAGISKVSICLTASTKAIASLLKLESNNRIIAPVGFLTVGMSAIIFRSNVDLFGFLEIYYAFAAPAQLIFPLIIWVAAEIKAKKSGVPTVKRWKQPENEQSGESGSPVF